MRFPKRGYRVAGVIVAGMLVVSGCGGDDEGDAAAPPAAEETAAAPDPNAEPAGEVTIYGCKPQNTLIPSNTNETCGGNVLDAVTARLVRYNPDTGDPENDIASAITTEDAKVYTIELKEGVLFHDGTEVKAKNFVDAWNYAAFAPNAQLGSYFFEVIKGYKDLQGENPKAEEMSGLKVVDDYTFTVTTAGKNSTFPQRLGYTAFAPLPDSFFEQGGVEEFEENPIGAGPYKLIETNPNRAFVLQYDEEYEAAGDRPGKPNVAKVTMQIFREIDAAYNEVIANNLDFIDTLPTSALEDAIYKEDLDGRFIQSAEGVIQAINFPPSEADDSYDNVDLRRAISKAIDREAIVDVVFAGTRQVATGWVAPVAAGYEAGACGEWCEYDAEAAKALFDEAGGIEGPITLSFNAGAGHEEWTEAACVSIRNALETECLTEPYADFATFRELITNREMEGMFRAGWQMDYPSIENFLGPLYGTGAGSNDGEYSNPEFDALLDEAAAQTEESAIYSTYQEAERLLAEDMPSIPLWYGDAIGGHSDRIGSVKFSVFGTVDLSSIVLK